MANFPGGYYLIFLISALSPDPEDNSYPLMGCPSIAKIIKIEYSPPSSTQNPWD